MNIIDIAKKELQDALEADAQRFDVDDAPAIDDRRNNFRPKLPESSSEKLHALVDDMVDTSLSKLKRLSALSALDEELNSWLREHSRSGNICRFVDYSDDVPPGDS